MKCLFSSLVQGIQLFHTFQRQGSWFFPILFENGVLNDNVTSFLISFFLNWAQMATYSSQVWSKEPRETKPPLTGKTNMYVNMHILFIYIYIDDTFCAPMKKLYLCATPWSSFITDTVSVLVCSCGSDLLCFRLETNILQGQTKWACLLKTLTT